METVHASASTLFKRQQDNLFKKLLLMMFLRTSADAISQSHLDNSIRSSNETEMKQNKVALRQENLYLFVQNIIILIKNWQVIFVLIKHLLI
jgi:hypothetical protein